ncbi:MAG: GyrI-like domain-containing protein [Pseudomonadales bacterium]
MKMLPSILCTALITGAVWGTVWAQQPKPIAPASAEQSQLPFAKDLVGLSQSASYEDAERTAKSLFTKLSENQKLIGELKDIKTIDIYLVYVSQDDKLRISAAVDRNTLKSVKFDPITVPAGRYDVLAPRGSSADQLSAAWGKLDSVRKLGAVVESYQLDAEGKFVSAHSFVNYQ